MKKIISALCAAAIAVSSLIIPAGADAAVPKPDNGSSVVVDAEGRRIGHLCGIPTVSELKMQFTDPDGVSVRAADAELSPSDPVPNGAVLTYDGTDYSVAVSGDMTCDAKVNAKDVSRMLRIAAGYDGADTTGAYDVNLDGADNSKDIAVVLKYLAGWKVSLGAPDTFYTEQAQRAENEATDMSIWFGDNLVKEDRNVAYPTDRVTDVIRLAKNEIEFTQVYVYSDNEKSGITAEITEFTSPDGATMKSDVLTELYFSVKDAATKKNVSYPDALPPATKAIKLDAMTAQGFAVKVWSTPDTPAGIYRAKVSILQDGAEIKTAYVYAKVWDFALSEKTACETAFGLNHYNIYATYGQYDSDDEVLYSAYYDFLLENRITAYCMPFSVNDDRADAYMSNPRVTSFMIDGGGNANVHMTDEELAQAYEKLKDHPEWMEKGYFYYVDEPGGTNAVYGRKDTVEASAKRLSQFFPDFRLTVPYYHNPSVGGKDMTEALSEYVKLWCPVSSFWTPYNSSVPGAQVRLSQYDVEAYGYASERFAREVEGGDHLWWYICIQPQYPYANFFSTYQGPLNRMIFWQQYLYGVSGLLYWSVNDWQQSMEWRTMDCGFDYGDGRLIYCGNKYKLREPISSIRLEIIRDGIEDYQYLTQIEEILGRDAAMEFVNRITTGIVHYNDDAENMKKVRNEMGDLLESLGKK